LGGEREKNGWEEESRMDGRRGEGSITDVEGGRE